MSGDHEGADRNGQRLTKGPMYFPGLTWSITEISLKYPEMHRTKRGPTPDPELSAGRYFALAIDLVPQLSGFFEF